MEEIWQSVKGYDGIYEVSNIGNVKRLSRTIKGNYEAPYVLKEKILILNISPLGYHQITLWKNKKANTKKVHRLVAEKFIKNPLNLPQVNHKNGNKLDNYIENLEWCDQTYNNIHARKTGLNVSKKGKQHHAYGFNNKKSHILKNLKTGNKKSLMEVANEYKVCRTYIYAMMIGKKRNRTDYIMETKVNHRVKK